MKQLTSHSPQRAQTDFPVDFERCMHRLRGALTDLLAAAGESPGHPQELARGCGLNKNLAWKVCKIINSTDSYGVAQHIPGSAAMRILLEAFERRGVPMEVRGSVTQAMGEFDTMVRLHVGDRSNLELYLGSIQKDGIHSSQLEMKRRLAYQGNSAIWGVQARVAFGLKAVSPTHGDPERADLTAVGGLLAFRRLRPTASWPLLEVVTLSENVEVCQEDVVPIDPDSHGKGAPLIHEFCSSPLAATREIVEGDTTTYEICEGPVGNTAAADIVYGSIGRNHVPVRADTSEAVGEHYFKVDTPVEMLQFDLLVHRSLPFDVPPRLVTYSMLNGDLHFPLSKNQRYHLPGRTQVQSLGSSLPGLATPHIPRYGQLVTRTCEAIGYPLEEFQGFRVTLSYPPIPSMFVMHHHLGAPR